MPKQFTAPPLEERKSQNLSMVDYLLSDAWKWLPLVGMGAGFAIGKITKNKVLPFNGTPTFVQQLLEKVMLRGTKAATGKEMQKLGPLEYFPQARFFSDTHEGQVELAKSALNVVKGLEMGIVPAAYFSWKKKETTNVGAIDTYAKLGELSDIKPSNDALLLEKRSLEQQLAHEKEKAAPQSRPATPSTIVSEAQQPSRLAMPAERTVG